MTEKRFTDIEHDYENARIKCKDNGCFMIYPIYDDSDEGLPSLGDLLNGLDGTVKDLSDDYQRLMIENKELKAKIDNLDETIKNLSGDHQRLRIENRELKRQLRGALNG